MFVKKGSEFFIQGPDERDIHEVLPPAVYTVQAAMGIGYYLSLAASFELPKRLYGDTLAKAARILNTFSLRTRSTGVLLAGEKGSGKTLLSKVICSKVIEAGMPVLLITSPHRGDSFLAFLEEIKQDCAILFDEFEKVYPTKEDQSPLLTVFDGVFSQKKLFILTVNDTGIVTNPMKNRPGRLFYNIEFKGLNSEFIQEYCLENLKDVTKIPQVQALATLFYRFSFDMLQAVVEELNRYNESPMDLLEILNTKPDPGHGVSYLVKLVIDGIEVSEKNLIDQTWRGNPLIGGMFIYYKTDGVEDDDEPLTARFSPGDLTNMVPAKGVFVFTNPQGNILTLTREPEKTPNYAQFLV